MIHCSAVLFPIQIADDIICRHSPVRNSYNRITIAFSGFICIIVDICICCIAIDEIDSSLNRTLANSFKILKACHSKITIPHYLSTFGGSYRALTCDPLPVGRYRNQLIIQKKHRDFSKCFHLVEVTGLEPVTLCL